MEFLQNISPREYQQKIFETCKGKNCLVVLPTGLGKTLIALMLTIERMKKFPGEKVVFLAPTKPLAEQHQIYFKKNLPELFGEMQLFTGAVNAEKRKKIWETADIIFSTPQCLDGETEIFTEDGPIKIKDFFGKFKFEEKSYVKGEGKIAIIKEKVLGYDGKRITFLEASKALKLPAKELIKIKTELGNHILCTKEHPLLTISPEGEILWKQASELNKGEYIASIKKIDINEKSLDILSMFSENKSLKIADKLLTKKLIAKLGEREIKTSLYSRYYHSFMPINLFSELSKKIDFTCPLLTLTDNYGKSAPVKLPNELNFKLAYILGGMLGDGHIGNRINHGGEVVFSDLDRKSICDEMKNAIKDIFGIEMKKNPKGLVTYNSAFASILFLLGIPKGNKAKIIQIPKYLFFANENTLKGFIKGIFDTDGNASKYNVSISSASKKFVSELKWLFLKIGISGNVETRKSKGSIIGNRKIKESEIFTFRFSGRKNLEKFLEVNPNKDKCKKLIETLKNTKRPQTRSKEILPVPELMKKISKSNKENIEYYKFSCLSIDNLNKISEKLEGENAQKLRNLLNLPIRWVKIKEKEKYDEEKEVYDLTIEKHHNFIANSLINHNCVANDLKNNLYDLKNVCLLVEDEAHRCIKNYDYNYVAQIYKKQSIHQRILGLTASPGSETSKIKEICKNLSIEEVELRTRDSQDVNQYLQELEFEKILVDFPPKFEEMRQILKKIYDDYVEELRKRNVLFGPVNKIILIQLQKKIMASLARGNKNFSYFHAASACAQAIKIQHSMELLETQTLASFNNYLKTLLLQASKKQSKGVVTLVNKPEFNYVFEQSNEMLIKNEEHPKLSKLIELIKEESKKENIKIIIFTQFRDTASIIAKRLNEILKIRAKVFVGQAKKISDNKERSTGLSQKEQKKIIEDFSEGKINILCATSIHPEEFIVLRRGNQIMIKKIGEFVDSFIKENKNKTLSRKINGWESLTSDGEKTFFRPITYVHKHPIQNNLIKLKLSSGFDCLVTENHSLFSFNQKEKFIPSFPQQNKFTAFALKCPNYEDGNKIDIIKKIYENSSKEEIKNLFGNLDGLTQAKIRILKTNYKVLSQISKKKQSIIELTRITKKDYSTIIDCLTRLKKEEFIEQKRVKKNNKNISIATKNGLNYLKFLEWFFKNVEYKKKKYRFKIKNIPEEFNKFHNQNINVNYGKTKFPRFLELNESLARFLGFYVSEGSTRKTKSTSDVFLAARNKEMQKMMKESIENGLKLKIRQNWRGIAIDSQIAHHLIKYVFKAGIGAYNKEVPEIIFTASKNIKWEFLRAYFLGDGHLGKDRIVLTTVSRKLIVGLVLLLRMLGINKITIHQQKHIYRLNIHESLPFAKIKEKNKRKGHAYYSLIPNAINSEKAFEKYKNLFSYVPKNYIKCRKNGVWEKDICFDYIKKMENIEKPEFVYDLSVKETENFIGGTGLFCLHNSIAEEGLDIPEVNAVIFYEPIPSAIRSIQRRGRTARLMKGKLIILITKNTRDQTFYYASRSREKKMHSAIQSIKDDLANGNKTEEQKKLI